MPTSESAAGATSSPPRIDVFTLFPGIFTGPLDESIVRRARERNQVEILLHDLREWTTDRHRTADDTPYGGGAGMVMRVEPVVTAVEDILGEERHRAHILAMSAGGRTFTQEMAASLAVAPRVAIVCGRYEGIDQRAIEILRAEEISIGDYVLTGGELAAAVVIDAVVRLIPGVIDAASIAEESHQAARVEYPHYTRPPEYRGRNVPPVLLSGHHAEIERWRAEQSLRRTARLRPDLLVGEVLSAEERAIVEDELHPPEGRGRGEAS